jgi:hypothetical protein
MGYRSEVAYAIRFKNKEHRVRFMAVQFMNEWIKPEEFSLVDDETILFNKSGLKWYDEYEDVKQHSQILIDAKEQGCSYEFCRVGEDIGDIVYDGEYGTDDNGKHIDSPDIVCPTQYIYVETEGEPYPIGETLDTA